MKTGFHIGHKVTGHDAKKKAEIILEILNSRADQETIRAALTAFSQITKLPAIESVRVEGCHIGGFDAGVSVEAEASAAEADEDEYYDN